MVFFSIIIIVALFVTKNNNGYSKRGRVLSAPAPGPQLSDDEIFARKYLANLPDEYVVFSNILLPHPKFAGMTTQIDNIVVSPYGIFVIESKNYTGLVVGDCKFTKWRSYYGNNVFLFQNPLRQNYAHIKAVNMLFPELKNWHFISVASFSDPSGVQIRNQNYYSRQHIVLSQDIKSIIMGTRYNSPIMSRSDFEYIVDEIEKKNLQSLENNMIHIQNIQNRYATA